MSDTQFEAREDADWEKSATSDQRGIIPIENSEVQVRGDDETGFLANFIRDQPVLILSLAFGFGLLATSLLARRKT